MNSLPFSVIVAAYNREEATRETVRRLQACSPAAAEILVHLDNGADFPLPDGVRVIRSDRNVGPGGGRNTLIREAAHEWIASFDDDSHPEDSDYFAQLERVIQRNPKAGVIACTVRHRNPICDSPPVKEDCEVAAFVGCGCVYRKAAFVRTEGYIPLKVAYGMEEVDLALQLHELGISIVETSDLKVFHDTDLAHHDTPRIAAGSIMNQALLAWTRYPKSYWPRGLLQWLNKFRDNITRKRYRGALMGIAGTPLHLWRYRHLRKPLGPDKMASWLKLRESPRPVDRCKTMLSPGQ